MVTTQPATRDELHRLIDDLSDEDIATAARVLKGLLALTENDSGVWSLEDAPVGDPPSADELAAIREADKDIEVGQVLTHEETRRRLIER